MQRPRARSSSPAGDRGDPHAHDVAHLRSRRRRSPTRRSGRRSRRAIVHLPRAAADGRPTQDPGMFMRFLPKIRAASNVVITSHRRRADHDVEERCNRRCNEARIARSTWSLISACTNARALQGLEADGEALPRRQRRRIFRYVPRHRPFLNPAAQRTRFEIECYTSDTCYGGAFLDASW